MNLSAPCQHQSIIIRTISKKKLDQHLEAVPNERCIGACFQSSQGGTTMRLSSKKMFTGILVCFMMAVFSSAAVAETKKIKPSKSAAHKKAVKKANTKMKARGKHPLPNPDADVGITVVDTVNCICPNDLAGMNVMAPTRVRIKVFNRGPGNAKVFLRVTHQPVYRRTATSGKYLTLRSGEVRWLDYFNRPLLFDKRVGIKAELKLTTKGQRDPDPSNNVAFNNTCAGYLE